MQQPPGQDWPQQMQQQGYGQSPTNYGQPPSYYPPQQEQWSQQPYSPYPPQQGQLQQPIAPKPQWSQQPYWQAPPPPPKKKSRLPLIIGVIVVLVLFACVGAGVLASHVSSPNTSTSTNSSSLNNNSSTDTASTTVPTNKHYNQTDDVQVGNIYDIQIVSAKTATGSQFFQPQITGDVFLVFVIKVKNISSQEQAVSSLLNFTLLDMNGQKYDETIYPDAGATLDGKIEPGSLLHGSIVYEVPSSAKNFTLAFQASLLDQGQVIWNINI